MPEAAVRVLRGDVVESVHHASVVVSDARGRVVARYGNPRLVTFVRSSIKAIQALPLVETGAADHFGFTPEELALSVASHNGEDRHVQIVDRLLARLGLGAQALQCAPHAPFHKATADRVGNAYSSLHNNCSGKHAAMLAACLHNGWDVATYLDPGHPLQRINLANLAQEAGIAPESIQVATDGCGAPTFALPVRSAARAFARLTVGEQVRGARGRALARIRDAMLAHPGLVSGDDRVDARIMRAFPGDVWVKAGAEACFGMGVLSLGLGVAVKVEDGAARAVPPLLVRVLAELGIATEANKAALDGLWDEPVRNVAGRIVGRVECNVRLLRTRAQGAAAARPGPRPDYKSGTLVRPSAKSAGRAPQKYST